MKSPVKILVLILALVNVMFPQHKNVRVSSPRSYDPEEVTIAINPVNPSYLAAGANLQYFYSSSNSGLKWTESIMNSSLGVSGDPCVIYDGLGNLYYAHLSNPVSGYWLDRIVVQRSSDNGKTWNEGAGVGYQYPKHQDKEWMAADLHSQLYKDNIYIAWTEFDNYGSSKSDDSSKIMFSYSTDHGDTWAKAIRISDKAGNCEDYSQTVEGAVPAVGPNGEVYISWAGPYGILFDKSADGGKTFGADIFVDSIPGGWDLFIPGIYRCNGFPVTACDTSNSTYRGNIYINWSDQRNGTNNTDIFFSKSSDGGLTWSETKKVNSDDSQRHQFFNWMIIDQTTGFIYICYYDRRNTKLHATDFYISRSTDGGENFSDFQVNEESFSTDNNIFIGDYTNIAAYGGTIYPIWTKSELYNLSVFTAIVHDSSLTVSVPDFQVPIPGNFLLMQNYPNPFNPSTIIGYYLPFAGTVTLELFDLLGSGVKTLLNEHKTEGYNEYVLNASDLPSGIYLYRLTLEGEKSRYSQAKKLTLLK